MRSSKPGKNTSADNTLYITKRGIQVIVGEQEYFLCYKDYPWFKSARLEDVFKFKLSKTGIHWSELDVDLEFESLEQPGKFPLTIKRT